MFKAMFRSRAPKAQAASATAKVQPRIVQRYAETYVDSSGKEQRRRTLARDEEGGFYNVKSNSKSGTEEFEYLNVGARTNLDYDSLSKSYRPSATHSSGENLIASEARRYGYKIRPESEEVETNPFTGNQQRKVKLGSPLLAMSAEEQEMAHARNFGKVAKKLRGPGTAATGADQFTAAAVKSHIKPTPSSSSGAWSKANWTNVAKPNPPSASSQTAQASASQSAGNAGAAKPQANPQKVSLRTYSGKTPGAGADWSHVDFSKHGSLHFGAPPAVNPGTDQPSGVNENNDPGAAVKKKGGRPKKNAGTTGKKANS